MSKEKSTAAGRNSESVAQQIERVKLDRIRTTPATQIRTQIHPGVVAEFARAMNDPANKIPPVVVFCDGEDYILADGFHRVAAARQNGWKEIPAEVRAGTQADALKCALSANREKCLPRTHKDKRRSVALAMAQWPHLSIREIARLCAVSDPFVGTWRRKGNTPELESGEAGKDSRTSPNRFEHHDFGDEEAEARRLRHLSETWPATCQHCHQEYRYDKREREPEACPSCAAVVRECKLCGRPFEPQSGKEFCSSRCADWCTQHNTESHGSEAAEVKTGHEKF